ncbi:MAG: DoxX family protein [Caulobacteraceae bacterium]
MDRAETTLTWMRRTGWAITVLVALFLAMDCVIKLIDIEPVKQTMTQLGYPITLDRLIGVIELACLILYLIPRTAILGAILQTAIMGGAIASHMRLGDPLFSHTLFGVYLGLLVWGGLWFRDARLRAMIPLRSA